MQIICFFIFVIFNSATKNKYLYVLDFFSGSSCNPHSGDDCATNTTINQKLAEIPLYCTKLIINLYDSYPFIDFSKLSHKMKVTIHSKFYTYNVLIAGGNVQNYLYELTFYSTNIIVKNTNLTLEHLTLLNSEYIRIYPAYYINFKYLNGDPYSLYNIKSYLSENANITQIGVILHYVLFQEPYQIKFDYDSWTVYDGNISSPYLTFPYKYSQQLGIIGLSSKFELFVDSLIMAKTKPINITLFHTEEFYDSTKSASLLEDNQKLHVQIVTSGYWERIKGKTDVYITFYGENAIIDTHLCDSRYVNITQFESEYEPSSKIPYPTDRPLPTPSRLIDYYGNTATFNINGYCLDVTYSKCFINLALASIPLYIDHLLIYINHREIEIDFTKLSHQLSVQIILTSKYYDFYIRGADIRNYVSELSIINFTLNGFVVRKNILRVGKLNLINSKIGNNSISPIYVSDLRADFFSMNSIIPYFNGKIESEQISIILDSYSPEVKYQVMFNNSGWTVFSTRNSSPYFYLPYNFSSKLGIIGISDHYDFLVESQMTTKTKPVNIILYNSDSLSLKSFSGKKILGNYLVKITTSGNWRGVTAATDVYFTSYSEYTKLDTSQCDATHVNIIEKNIDGPYDIIESPYPTPLSTPLPSRTPPPQYEISYTDNTANFEINEVCDSISSYSCFINEVLYSIPPNIEYLVIYLCTDNIEIDFTKLPHQMCVEVVSNTPTYNFYLTGGDIRKYVSQLTIIGLSNYGFIVKNSILYVEKLNLLKSVCNFYKFDKKIDFSYLAADNYSLRSIYPLLDKVNDIEQISLILDSYSPEKDYSIGFNNTGWFYYYRFYAEYSFYIPYQYANKFGLIGLTHFVDLDDTITTIRLTKTINITLFDFYSTLKSYYKAQAKLLENNKFFVEIDTRGSWFINDKLDVYFTSYEDYVNLTITKYALNYINVIQQPIKYPSIPSGDPYPSPFATESASPTVSQTPAKTPSISPRPTLPVPSPTPSTEIEYVGNIAYFHVKIKHPFNQLRSIPMNIEMLIIYIHKDYIFLNFQALSHKMIVRVISQDERYSINVFGCDLRNYVSEILFQNFRFYGVQFTEGELIVDKIIFINSIMSNDYKYYKFQCSNLVTDVYSYGNIRKFYSFPVKQFSFVLDSYAPSNSYRISFNNTAWTVHKNSNYIFSFGYDFSSMFNVIGVSNEFELYTESDVVMSQPFGIKLLDFCSTIDPSGYSDQTIKLFDDYKFLVKIYTNGDWKNLWKKANVYFSSYKDNIILDTEQCKEKKLNLTIQQIEDPSEPSNFPYPMPSDTPLPTQTPAFTPMPYNIRFINNIAYFNITNECNDYSSDECYINTVLELIPMFIDTLVIIVKEDNIEIDLARLTHKISVIIYTFIYGAHLTFPGGDMTNKVSQLTLNGGDLSFYIDITRSNLIVDTINLLSCRIESNIQYNFTFKYFAADFASLSKPDFYRHCIKEPAEQISFILTPSTKFSVYFEKFDWELNINSQTITIPFRFASKVGIIGVRNEFLIGSYSTNVEMKPINITLFDLYSAFKPYYNSPAKLLDDYKYPVSIITRGNWGNAIGKVDVYFTSYDNYVDLDTSLCNLTYINIIKKSIDGPSPSDFPYPSPSAVATPTKTPNPSYSPTVSPKRTPTRTPLPSRTPTRSIMRSPYPTKTPHPSYTPTKTPNPTFTVARTPKPTKTPMPTGTPNPTKTPIPCNVEYCFICLQPNICYLCDDGYDLVDQQCILHSSRTDLCLEHIIGCLACVPGSDTNCSTCNPNDHWQLNESICSCEKGYDNLENVCVYHANRTDLCFKYIPECLTCEPGFDDRCQICPTGYDIIDGNCIQKKVNCEDYGIYHCDTCLLDNDRPFCTSCYASYSGEKCDQCIDGYYAKTYSTGVISCTACGIGCLTCNNSISCDTYKDHFNSTDSCQVGYFVHELSNGTFICDECAVNCESCSSSDSCDSCQNGYTNEQNRCEECESNYYRDYSSGLLRCLPCPINCDSCTDATYCSTCKKGYINTESNSICNACDSSEGYVEVSTDDSTIVCTLECKSDSDCGKNQKCQSSRCVCTIGYTGQDCQECATGYTKGNTNECDACETGYFKERDGSCVSCSSNCISCSSTSNCHTCQVGYILTAKKQCTKQSSPVIFYEDPKLKYVDDEIVNEQCLDGKGGFTLNENISSSIVSSSSTDEKILRVDIPHNTIISKIDLSSTSLGLFLDLTNAKLGQSIDLHVAKDQKESYLKFSNDSDVVLNINNNELSSINIIGGRRVTFNAETSDSSQLHIGTISPIMNSNEQYIIESNVSVIADSLELYGSQSVKASQNTRLSVNNVKVNQAATAKINNVQINNILEIGPSSQIEFEDNSHFGSESRIVINYSSNSQTKFASLIGNLPANPPHAFSMILNANANSLNDDSDSPKFLLAQGDDRSEFKCSKWQERCSESIGESEEFNDCKCLSNSDLQDEDYSRLYAVIESEDDNGDDNDNDNDDDNKKGKSLPIGAIIGITVTAVVVLVVAVATVIICLRRKAHNENNTNILRNSLLSETSVSDINEKNLAFN